MQSISSKTDKNVNYLKRNSTSLHPVGNSKRMKHRPANSTSVLEVSYLYTFNYLNLCVYKN